MSDIDQVSARVEDAHQRLNKVEDRVQSLETVSAVSTERMTHIQTSLSKIETMVGRVAWLIIGGLIAAAITFIIKGGLNVH